MNALKNKVSLIGNLGGNPQVVIFENKKKIARMSIATSETFKGADGEKVKETHWHKLVALGRNAEIAETYLQKGYEIAVEGRLVNRSFTDKYGVKKFVSEILINNLLIIGKKSESKKAINLV